MHVIIMLFCLGATASTVTQWLSDMISNATDGCHTLEPGDSLERMHCVVKARWGTVTEDSYNQDDQLRRGTTCDLYMMDTRAWPQYTAAEKTLLTDCAWRRVAVDYLRANVAGFGRLPRDFLTNPYRKCAVLSRMHSQLVAQLREQVPLEVFVDIGAIRALIKARELEPVGQLDRFVSCVVRAFSTRSTPTNVFDAVAEILELMLTLEVCKFPPSIMLTGP